MNKVSYNNETWQTRRKILVDTQFTADYVVDGEDVYNFVKWIDALFSHDLVPTNEDIASYAKENRIPPKQPDSSPIELPLNPEVRAEYGSRGTL